MKTRERLIIYPLLAVIALAAFLDLRSTQDLKGVGEASLNKLTILDEKGRPRITLGSSPGGSYLRFTDGEGKMRIDLREFGEPGLVFKGQKMRIALVVANEAAGLAFHDQNGKERLAFGVLKEDAEMVLRDRNGKQRITLDLNKEEPGVLMYDRNGNPRMSLLLLHGVPRLAFLDRDKTSIWSAP